MARGDFWTDQRVLRLPRYLLAAVVVVTLVVFVVAGIAMGDFDRAWDTLSVGKGPFDNHAKAKAVGLTLSILGYLFLPAVIGLAIADWVTRFTRRNTQPHQAAENKIGDKIKSGKAASSAPASRTKPAP